MFRAAFIGIDKYEDPAVRELTGARRDALALWALFNDSIPEIQSSLLIDEDATVYKVRAALDNTLGAAEPEDIVVLSFSGHGTHDHRIVNYDSQINDLSGSTIPMDELAVRFKESKAKIILFILDCCFSGGAPARVLENSPIPRAATFPLETLAGKGRILISAANVNEVAYELPGSQHGILTKALIEELQRPETSLTSLMDRVMEGVRVEAARIGFVQTPVMFGYVEGGLTIPTLRPGERFFAAFPEATGLCITADVHALKGFGIPQSIVDEWADQFSGGLNDLQLEAVNDFRVLDGSSLLVVAPTSSGKTFIGEMAAVKSIVDGCKAVFLLPYKALVNEKFDQFGRMYGETLKMRVVRCTGDHSDSTGAFVRGKYELALLTYEMFFGLALSTPTVLNQIGLVVIDEAQFIADPGRGITVELLLTYLIASREKGISPQLIALSAVIGNISNFDEWLNCKSLITNKRPVPLTEGVLDRSGVFQFLGSTGETQIKQLLPLGFIRQRKEKASSQDVIVPLVQALLQQNEKEQIIVFRNRRGPAEGCARYLARELGLPAAAEALAALPKHDLSSASTTLRDCLNGGTAFHSTNLLPEEKQVVERAFRDPKGNVRVLAATTTVAAGINTPASTVILAEQEFVGEDGRAFTVAEYKNMAGRAGRLGFNEEGQAIILANNAYERDILFRRYVMGTLESLSSSFDPEQIETWVLRLLAQVGQVPIGDVTRLLANTYGGYLSAREHPEWQTDIRKRLDDVLQQMIAFELLEEETGYVRLSLLGQVCGRSSLSFKSVMRLISLLRSVQSRELTAEGLMALTQGLPELDNVFIPLMKTRSKAGKTIVQSETRWPSNAVQRFGQAVVASLQRNASDFFDYYARCKRAAILWDWVRGIPMDSIEQCYTVSPYYAVGYGHVRNCADATRFHLRAASQIAPVMFIDQGPTEDSVDALLRQLEFGIPVDALDLVAIPIGLTRGEYLALYHAGIKNLDDLWARSDAVGEILGAERSEQLEKLRPRSSAATA